MALLSPGMVRATWLQSSQGPSGVSCTRMPPKTAPLPCTARPCSMAFHGVSTLCLSCR